MIHFGKEGKIYWYRLNPCKNNCFERTSNGFKHLRSPDQILESLEKTKCVFEQALSVSNNASLQIHSKREPNSYFVNNSFSDALLIWEANIDI